jgi:hypothetical protein
LASLCTAVSSGGAIYIVGAYEIRGEKKKRVEVTMQVQPVWILKKKTEFKVMTRMEKKEIKK